MANHDWNGAAGDCLDPAQWTPNDVPLYSADDVATISTGTLRNAEPDNITPVLGHGPSTTVSLIPKVTIVPIPILCQSAGPASIGRSGNQRRRSGST